MQQVKVIYFDDISGPRREQFEAGPYLPEQARAVADNLSMLGARDVKLVPYNEKEAA